MTEEETITMYRPCSRKELDLVIQSAYSKWPPRLPEQPIFYPVTNQQYAAEINKWNLSQYGNAYITKFKVKKSFVQRYDIQQVGDRHHTEWWIPAEELEELNKNIVGLIEVISEEANA